MHSSLRSSGTINRQRLFWRIQVCGWGASALLSLGFLSHITLGQALTLGAFRALFGFVVTSFLLRPLARGMRKGTGELPWLYLVIMFFLCGVLAFLDTRTTTFLASVIGLDFARPGVVEFLSLSLPVRWALYVVWCAFYFGILYWIEAQHDRLRIAETQAALRTTELQVLRAQVNPHFLFNALNSLLAESNDPASVQRLVLALATYLRFSLRHEQNTDRLGVELDALDSYLCVEKMRFEEDLEYSIESDAASRQASAPVALIQPLLENAIKYGQRSKIRPLKVRIITRVEEEDLVVQVINSGCWTEPGSASSTGVGLSNLRRRLDLLYPGRASVAVTPGDQEVRVQVKLSLSA